MKSFYKKSQSKIKISLADKWFSFFIRLRDTYDNGLARCVTCNKPEQVKYMDCGHFITREKPNTRFNEKNSHAQCKACNNFGKGEQAKHAIRIDELYGVGTAFNLSNLGDVRGGKNDLAVVAKEYRLKANALAKEKGFKLW